MMIRNRKSSTLRVFQHASSVFENYIFVELSYHELRNGVVRLGRCLLPHHIWRAHERTAGVRPNHG